MTTHPYSIGMKAKAIYLLLAVSLLTSCKKETQTVDIEGRYTIELPVTLTKTNSINEEASLQYQDNFNDLYTIVIDEPKATFTKALKQNSLESRYENNLEGYSKLITDGLDSSLSIKEFPDFEETTINGLKARMLSFEGVSAGNKVYWKLAFIEGSNTYYQVMVWTAADKRKKSEKEMAAIIHSFKEMN
jgi:hypothetical protein